MQLIMAKISPEHLEGCSSHEHGDWEIILGLRGQALLQVGEEEYHFCEGMIVCLPPNIPHQLQGLPDYQDLCLKIRDFVPPGWETVPVYQDDEEKRFLTLARMIYQAFFSEEANGASLAAALLEAAYQLLVGWSIGGIRHGQVAALVNEMIFNISNSDFDIADYIKRSGYCADHFRRCFKREMGKTPTAYMIGLRLDHARRLLELPKQGGYTIAQIARLSGFTDPYYFSTMFRKYFGHCPTEHTLQIQSEVTNIY